ncbi:PDR/VanB family oxidoreductase [Paeniroseomonas aquatica]|uniref:PDR/VanB family oxidoreductase n=1 Tax=Paeniroseomonas aquatica TaxID=373043 RepID=A0ABT8AA97_9PROT|nr:PDR/VanB family oxidoreductase [Paeniroseomonas aquatica]MDN3566443.1 PDR/VanB family oxidoreductase [Paeniroseomonas aquatica]
MRHIRTILRAAEPAGPGIRLLTLMDPDGWPLPRFRPGAHLDLHLPEGRVRAYSLCGDPARQDRWLVAVKREAEGRGGSAYLHDGLAVGDAVATSLPRCTFPLAPGATRHVFIAGGIGVTPFLSMAAALDRAGGDYVLHLLHRDGVPLPALLPPRSVLHDTRGGRPALPGLLGPPGPGIQAYCCGPAGLIEAFAAATAGWPAGQAQVEHFVPPPLPPDPEARPFTLVLAKSGRSLALPAGAPLLPAIRALGAEVEASCEGGICGACRVRWLEGPPVHRDRVLRPEERATDLMACVAGCAGPRLVLDL